MEQELFKKHFKKHLSAFKCHLTVEQYASNQLTKRVQHRFPQEKMAPRIDGGRGGGGGQR